MSTSGGYHEYIERCSVHWGDIMMHVGHTMMHVGDTMSTLGDVQHIGGYHEYIGGYHEYIRGCSVRQGGIMSTLGFSIEIERLLSTCSYVLMISP